MKLSDAGLKFIADEEGWVDHLYQDFAGKWTIGYGHLVRPGEKFPARLTIEQGLALLKQDAAWSESVVNDALTRRVNQGAFDALVSFVFNLGASRLKSSTLLQLVNQGDQQAAANEFPKWRLANGVPSKVLERRRARERTMFLAEPFPARELQTPSQMFDDPLHVDAVQRPPPNPFGFTRLGEN